MTSRLLLGICKTSLAFSTAIWAYIYFLYKGLKEFTFIFKHNIYVMSIFWIVIVRFEMLLGCNRVYTRCYCSSYMNALSIGWKKTKVIFCCTYCLWRVGTSVGRWEGSVHWLKVLNPGLGFSLPRGGLNTAGFGVGHLGSVRCALRLSHWNWETPSWGVQVAGDRQHEERERECAREKRERARERERGQYHEIEHKHRDSEKFREATDDNLSCSAESCSLFTASLSHECPWQNWKPQQRAQREHQNLKVSGYVAACT